jgi:hypothetical protein
MISFKRLTPAKVRELNKKYGASIVAGKQRYKLVWCEWVRWDDRELYGLCDSEKRQIFVTLNQIQETLAHELMHAEIYEIGMRQMPSWSQDLEELVCECASRMFSQFKINRG